MFGATFDDLRANLWIWDVWTPGGSKIVKFPDGQFGAGEAIVVLAAGVRGDEQMEVFSALQGLPLQWRQEVSEEGSV